MKLPYLWFCLVICSLALVFQPRAGAATIKPVISAGAHHSLALQTNGTLWAWGSNSNGQLGLGDTADRPNPVKVGTDTNWVAVNVGYSFSLAFKANGSPWAWVQNYYGQLGLGDTTDRLSPVNVWTRCNPGLIALLLE